MTTKTAKRISEETFSARFALAETDSATRTFKGMASVFGAPIDAVAWPTIIERGAFIETLKDQGDRVKILWQHDTHEPIGRPVSLRETEQGLELVGRLDPIPQGDRALAQIKSGTLTDLSIGFDPLEADYAQDFRGETYRILRKVKLWEISIVTFGAQRAATMEANARRGSRERERRLRLVEAWAADAEREREMNVKLIDAAGWLLRISGGGR
jgi:hypothetical protein